MTMHVSATVVTQAGKTRRETGPWRMEAGGWRLEAEARDYRCTTTSQSSIDCPFALSLPPEQKNQGGKPPSLVLLATLCTYVRTSSMASQPSPLGAPVLTSQQANLTPSILPTPPPDVYLSWSLAAQSPPPQDRRLFLFDSVLKETGLATRGPTAVTK